MKTFPTSYKINKMKTTANYLTYNQVKINSDKKSK